MARLRLSSRYHCSILAAALLAALVLGSVASGCGSRAVGSAGDSGIGDPDAASHEDGGARPDGGQASVWGTLQYRDERWMSGSPGMSAQLTAAFFDTSYQPSEAPPAGFVETRVTYDNVECDIYFTSPLWGAGPPPLPPEPEQIDVGEVRLESAFDSEEAFSISWLGSSYSVDSRPSSELGLPGWVLPGELEALAVFLGSPVLPAGNRRLTLAPAPTLLEPLGEGVVQPDSNGLFRIAWDAAPGVTVQVRLDMNMDWDNAVFLCRPPAGHGQILVPQTWLNEYSWGYAELRILGRQDERFAVGSLDLRLRARRAALRTVQFEIVW